METKIFRYHRRGVGCWFLLAKLLIVVGLVLLGLNSGFIPQTFKQVIFSWQMLVMILGGLLCFHCRFFKGIIMILLGGFFIIPKLQAAMPEYFAKFSGNFVENYYPLLLIAAGLFIIIYMFLPSKCKCCQRERNRRFFISESGKNKNGFGRNYVFSGGKHIVTDEVFNGGDVNVVFGGCEIDLRRTTLPEGETFMNVSGAFGGVQIFVPQTWDVELHTSGIFGGFNDLRAVDESKIDHSRKLIIKSSFAFGGGEIKN